MEEANALDVDRLCAIIESMLLVSSEPLALQRIREIVVAEVPAADPGVVDLAVSALLERYADPARAVGRGFRLDLVADGLQLRTPAESAPFLRRLLAARPPKLTKPAMETLAVIAYRQPVTKPEIESIRGVDVGAVLKALLDRDLIRIIGKSDDLGRPILYGTTKRFLELFGLRSLGALPTLREYHELDEVHQQHVDELYENEPRISDLAAKAAFLVERSHDGDLDALAEAEASVEAADKRTEAVLAGDAERPTDPPPAGTTEVSAPAEGAEVAPAAPSFEGEGEGRPTEAPPPAASSPAPRARKGRRARASEPEVAEVASAAEAASEPERPTDAPPPPPPPLIDDAVQTEDLPTRASQPATPRKTKLRRKRGADQETNDE